MTDTKIGADVLAAGHERDATDPAQVAFVALAPRAFVVGTPIGEAADTPVLAVTDKGLEEAQVAR